MSEAEEDESESPKKKGKMGLVLGLVFALLGGGGGFFATYSGMLGAGSEKGVEGERKEVAEEAPAKPLPPIAFVPLDPIVISIDGDKTRHLRFRAELEVVSGYEEEVDLLRPRILDVLNTYLRAVDSDDFERAGSLIELRSQMLRRIQIVTGEGRVRDLLIAEFVVS